MFKELLVPLDATPEAAVALRPALTLARATGARISLVQVTPAAPGDRAEDEAAAAELGLERVAAELGAAGVALTTNVRRGSPAEQIVAEAEERDADLIVMATHAYSGLRRWVHGSVADQLLHTTTTPLLLVRSAVSEN